MHIKRQSSIITLTQGRRILDIGKSSFLSLLVLIIAPEDWFIDMLIVSNLNDYFVVFPIIIKKLTTICSLKSQTK